MWWHELSVEFRPHRKLCTSSHQSPALACHVPDSPSRVKLNKGGNSFWLGILAPSPRNSSKNGCTIASTALNRAPGVYSSNFATKSIASGAVRGRKTYNVASDTPRVRTPSTDLVERMGFDLRKLVLHVIGIHRLDLFSGGCAKNLDNFHQLIDTALTREEWLAQHQLRHDTTRRPYVYSGNTSSTPHAFFAALTDIRRVVGSSENELWCAVVPRADITDVGLARHENLCRPKVAQLQNPGSGVQEQVLGFDVTMTDANRVDVSEGPQELIHVQFDLEGGHGLFEFGIVATGTIHGFRYIFEHKVEINLVLLEWGESLVR